MTAIDTHAFAQDRSAQPVLLREDRGSIALLTLNRPQSRNSLSEALLISLRDMLGELAASPAISVIVLTGAPPVFCAGHDLREMTARRQDGDRGREFYRYLMGLCSEVMQAVMNCPKPVIAAVNGTATAAGCQLVASCDLAIASEDAKFATPGVNIGLFCSTPMVALSRNVPRKRAMEMLLLGESTDAATALQMGLVNRVVPADQVFSHAMDMAGTIASKSSGTIKFGKEAFYRQLEMPVAEAYDYAAEIMTENMLTRDAEEGIGAFLQKRPPRWGKAD
jgi:enoyl-CoA hydratase/carnithine racemase